MCNNVLKWFLRAFAVVAALTVTSCADSPDEDDIVIPQCTLSIDGTTIDEGSAAMMAFDETGGTKQFSIRTTGEWEISGLENAPQSFALTTSKGEEKYTGKGDETFTVTLGEATTASRFSMTVSVYASIFGQKKVSDTRSITVVQTKGGALPVGKVIYANNFDKETATQTFGASGSSWPFLDQFEGWKNHEGEGAAEVTYDFKSVSARANSVSDGNYSNYEGSGSNNLLFGGSGYLTIQNIALSSTNLQLSFGTERYAYGESDNTFKNEEFLVTLSADGQSWSAPVAYAFEEGNDTNGKWNLATADFTLPEGTTTLYIKMATTLSGAHRVDDVKLTDGIGGQVITFEGGGDDPTPPTPGEAIYANNFDKEAATKTYGTNGTSWPYIDQFEGWKNENGSGASAVTYEGSGVSVRANSESNGSFSNYAGSGANNIFFGTNGTLTIGNIALTSNKLRLTFGTERYLNGEDNTFKNEEFNVTLSADGKTWSNPVEYSFEAGSDTNGKWNLATADFTLPESVKTLYIKFASTIASAHRIDDVTLTAGNGGQEITLEGGEDPNPPTPVESGTITMSAADIIANGTTTITENSYGSQNVNDASTYYTWKMNGVTFAGARICKATATDYAGLIQMQGNASDNTKQGFFGNADDLKKITKVVIVSKNTKYEPTEHLYVGTSAYPLGQNAVTRADMTKGEDGQTYTETFNISGDYGYFAVANDKQGAFYVESVTVYYGGEGGDEPTPPTPTPGTMTVADLVAKCKAAGSTQTALDAENDVVVEAVVVTDKDGGNTNSKNLAIMAEGATEAGNGVVLYGSGITDPADASYTWKSGDKVKVTLKAGQARACTYNGMYEITGSQGADWVAIEKIGTAAVAPVEITVDKLTEYQSMVVKIKDATSPAAAAEWCTADAYKTHTFTAGGSNLTVYVQKNAAAFVGKQFKASAKGDITGIVTLYKNAPQLAPRTADDVKAFNGEGGGQPGGGDEPQPGQTGVATYVPSQMGYADKENVSSATLNDGAVTLAFAGGNPVPVYYENGTSLRCYANSTITVKSDSKISKIVVTRGANDKGNTLTANVGTLSEDTLTWTGDSNEVVLTVSGTSGHIRIASMEITYGEGSGSGGEQPGGGDEPDQPDQPTAGKTAALTLADIAAVIGSYNNQYNDTTITAADGSVWTGFVAGNNTRLQLGWNTNATKSAAKSYLLVPDAGKVIKKITFTPQSDTSDNRVLALLPVDFTYNGESADDVKATAYAYSANTVKGSTEPISIDLTGKDLKRFMIRAVGGAVYLTNITIEYAE